MRSAKRSVATDPDVICKGCNFWKPEHDGIGECRRHPPVLEIGKTHGGRGSWPMTLGYDWCGDFKRLVETTKEVG